MSLTQDITLGVPGQRLWYAAPEGRPESVQSVAVYWHRDSDEHPEDDVIDGAPEIDAAAHKLNSFAGPGQANPRRLSLDSVSDVETEREYLITSTEGAKEWVEVVGVDSGGVDVRYPLTHVHPTGSAFDGTRIVADVSDAWAEDKRNLPEQGLDPRPHYRVRWVYVVDGVTYAKDTYFRLVRYAGRHGVRPMDVAMRSSSFALDQQRYEFNGERIIDGAYERVQGDLYANDLSDAAIRDRQVVRELTIRQAIMLHQLDKLYQGGGNAEAIQAAEADYGNYLNRIIQGSTKAPFDANADGAGNRVPRQNLWRTSGAR